MTRKRRAGEGSIYKVREGQWMAQVRVWDESAGKSRRIRRSATSRAKAQAKLDALKGTSRVNDPGDMTVAAYCRKWAASTLEVSPRAASTKHNYRNVINSPITPTLAATRLAKFTPAEVELWLVRLNEYRKRDGQPLAQSSKHTAYTVLKQVMDTAVRDGYLTANPLMKVTGPAAGSYRANGLSVDEVDALLAVAAREEQWWPLIAFIAFTGVRISEALALKWDAVDFEERTVHIVDSKTPSGRRTLPLVDAAADALKAARGWQRRMRLAVGPGWRRTGFVFTTALGTTVDAHNARRAQRRLLEKAGLPTDRPFHVMRHSLVRRLLRQGVPMPVVSQLIGHASIRTTVDIYGWMETPITADDLQAALDSGRNRALR